MWMRMMMRMRMRRRTPDCGQRIVECKVRSSCGKLLLIVRFRRRCVNNWRRTEVPTAFEPGPKSLASTLYGDGQNFGPINLGVAGQVLLSGGWEILSPHKNSFRFSAAISAAHLQWPWQDKYFTFTLSLRVFAPFFFLSVVCSPSDFGFPTKLSSLMRCESVPKTLTAKSNRGIYICGAGGAKGLREGPSKGCTKLKLN